MQRKKAFHLELTSSKQAPPCINFARGQKAVRNTAALFILQPGRMREKELSSGCGGGGERNSPSLRA
jgi:hypothetical protein